MAVAFRANGHKAETSSSSVAVLPAGLAADDLMLMAVGIGNSAAVTITTPSGWAQLTSSPSAAGGFGNNQRLAVYYRTAGASETAPTVTFSASNAHTIDILAFTGCDATTPINANAKAAWTANNSSTIYTHPTVTTTVDACGIVLLKYDNRSSSTNAVSSAPAGYAQIVATTSDGWGCLTATLGAKTPAGATGTLAVTYANTMGAVGYTVALAPPAAAGSTFVPKIVIL